MFIKKGHHYVFMAEAGEEDAGGGGAAGEASATGTTPAPADTAVATGDGAGSAASAGTGEGAAAEAGKVANVLEAGQQAPKIPEKYQVKKEDGTLDIEASSLKLAEAYGHLEKRLGSGDMPPKSAEEYEIAVPEALKDVWNPKEDPLLGEFLKEAHAAGYTQKQIDLAMNRYMDLAPKLVNGSQQLSADDCIAELKTEWKTEAQYKEEVGKAYKAAVAYAGNDAEAIIKEYGNDPRIVRFMARVGNELGEDKSLNPGGSQPGGTSVEAMMTSEAYTDPKHADHANVSKQVQEHFNRQAALAEKSGAVPVL